MTDLSIAMPPGLQTWVESRLAGGEYADAADYLRDLIRRDQAAASENRRWVKAMIDEGLASGLLDEDADAALDTVIAEDPDLRA